MLTPFRIVYFAFELILLEFPLNPFRTHVSLLFELIKNIHLNGNLRLRDISDEFNSLTTLGESIEKKEHDVNYAN